MRGSFHSTGTLALTALSLNEVLSSVENMMQLATIQQSYRHGVEQILSGFREQIGLEFAHLMFCLKHPVQKKHEFNAVTLVLELRERISREELVLAYESKDSLVQRNRDRLESVKRRYGDAGESPYKMNLQTDIDYYERMVRYHEEDREKIILELVSQHKIPREALEDEKTRRDFRVRLSRSRRINSSRATTSILSSSSLIPRKAMLIATSMTSELNPFLQPYRTHPGGNTTSQPSRKRNLRKPW